jgi:hypothetical protein
MSKTRHMPLGISFFLVFFLALEIYYFFFDYFTSGIYVYYGYTIASLSTTLYLLITMFLFIVIVTSLFAITYGFIKRRTWTRKYTMVYLVWAALWPLWGILISYNVISHVILLAIYILLIIYLTTAYVKKYFADIFRYGEYTLYKRDVTLKSGTTLTIHFFSKKIPASGTPTSLPDGYEVGISERSKMPYLRKIGRPLVYKHGIYTLYKRQAELKGGRNQTIYFFSGKKPKSGIPTSLPEGYVVGINKRSKLPYLRKQNSRKTFISKKIEITSSTATESKKLANVIYVVNNPQLGQIRGDWAVRSHGKIYSYHRTKINAINNARKIARSRDSTVMIQNTDGTFSIGFKPKPAKR